MPAETHTCREAVTSEDLLDLFKAVVTCAGDDRSPLADRRHVLVGIADDRSVLDLWDVRIEEYGERTLGEFGLEAFREAVAPGELAAAFARQCRSDADNVVTADQGDRP